MAERPIGSRMGRRQRVGQANNGGLNFSYHSSHDFLNYSSLQRFSELLSNEPDWSAIFAPKGTLLREGDYIKQTQLARTLATIASEGPQAFYKVKLCIELKLYSSYESNSRVQSLTLWCAKYAPVAVSFLMQIWKTIP